jgi:hypothetical protein
MSEIAFVGLLVVGFVLLAGLLLYLGVRLMRRSS